MSAEKKFHRFQAGDTAYSVASLFSRSIPEEVKVVSHERWDDRPTILRKEVAAWVYPTKELAITAYYCYLDREVASAEESLKLAKERRDQRRHLMGDK